MPESAEQANVIDGQKTLAADAALERLIGKILTEPEFRRHFVDDPAAAMADSGVALIPHDVQELVSTSRGERERMMSDLGERTQQFLAGLDAIGVTPSSAQGKPFMRGLH